MNAAVLRVWALASMGLVLGVLIATSRSVQVGDAGEYYAVAIALSRGGPPALSAAEITDLRARFAERGLSFPATYPQLLQGGRQDVEHFWLYPALAAPLVWIADRVGAHPRWAFSLLNTACLLAASALVLARLGPRAACFLCVSPIVWWIDKAHVEVFVFSLLASAWALLDDRPWWSLALLGAAAAQVPALIVPFCFCALAALRSTRSSGHRRVRTAIAAGLVLASMHPLYYLYRFSVPTPLTLSMEWRRPAINELFAVLADPNIGMLSNAPATSMALAFAVSAIAWITPRRVRDPAILASACSALVLLVVFSQTTNMNHGGTRGMSRYALWLIPVSVPWLREAARAFDTWGNRCMTVLAAASCAWSLVEYHPARPEAAFTPTAIASRLWSDFPSLNDPPAEIFLERLSPIGGETQVLPTATPTCSKLLMAGGHWPVPCPPEPVPPMCAGDRRLCYANQTASGYSFAPVPFRKNLVFVPAGTVWPDGDEARLRITTMLASMDWRTLRRNPRADDGAYVRAASNMYGLYVLQGPDRLFAFVAVADPGAALRLRLPVPMSAAVVELESGVERRIATLADLDLVALQVPPGRSLALVMTSLKGGV